MPVSIDPMRGLNVAIRADASVAIGSGHVMRCAALAETLRARGAGVVFVCRSGAGDMCGWLEAAGFAVRRLAPAPAGAGWRGRRRGNPGGAGRDHELTGWWSTTISWTRAGNGRWAQARARSWRSTTWLTGRTPATCCWTRIFIRTRNGAMQGGCRTDSVRLLGPDYALLRAEFGLARAQRRPRAGDGGRILCFFGGSDAGNATGMALDALALLALPAIAVDVVVGASNPWREHIEQRCKDMHGVSFHCQASNMARTDAGGRPVHRRWRQQPAGSAAASACRAWCSRSPTIRSRWRARWQATAACAILAAWPR